MLKAGLNGEDINMLLTLYMTNGKDFDISVSSGTGITPVDVYLDPIMAG